MCVRAYNGHLRDYTLVGWYIIEVLCIMAVSNFDFICNRHSSGITSTLLIELENLEFMLTIFKDIFVLVQ